MSRRIVVLADVELGPQILADCKSLTAQFADYLGEPVTLAVQTAARLSSFTSLLTADTDTPVLEVEPGLDLRAPTMTSAEFLWRDDGRPDWGAMWNSFCDLALYGGAPHRGEDSALSAVSEDLPAVAAFDAIEELQRGIWETTGLVAEPAAPGWIAVLCTSPKMAAWLCAAIIMENVEARCDDRRLMLPASPGFRLKDEVKSVITVVAKTNHYWEAHIAAGRALARPSGAELRSLRTLLAQWWEERRELRPGSAWEVPFPPRPGESVRVTREDADPAAGKPEIWRAALIRERAFSAYMEVEKPGGPIQALESLYEHVV